MPSIESLRAFLEKDPSDPFLHFGLAMALASAGRDDEALAQFDRTLEVDPDYVPAWFQKGRLLARQGDDDAARDVLGRGIDVAERVGDAHAAGEMRDFIDAL